MRLLIFFLLSLPLAAQVASQDIAVLFGGKRGLVRSGLAAGVQTGSANLLRYSEALDNAAWAKGASVTVSGDAGASPIASSTAEGVSMPASGGTYLWISVSMTVGSVYTFSVWIKANGSAAPIEIVSANTSLTTAVDKSAQIAPTSAWTRHSLTFTAGSGVDAVGFDNVSNLTAPNVLLWGAQLNEGSTPLPYVATTDLQSIASLPPGTATITRGANTGASTDDPTVSLAGWTFDSGDRVSGLPAKGSAWTTTNCHATECHTVTSAGTKYINGVADGDATEWDVGTIGGYTGLLTWWSRYDRVLSPGEVMRNYAQYQKPQINAKGNTLP